MLLHMFLLPEISFYLQSLLYSPIRTSSNIPFEALPDHVSRIAYSLFCTLCNTHISLLQYPSHFSVIICLHICLSQNSSRIRTTFVFVPLALGLKHRDKSLLDKFVDQIKEQSRFLSQFIEADGTSFNIR